MSSETELPPERAAELIEADAELVDVRTDEEHAAGRIPGARHIPLDRLQAEAETLDRGRPIVLYCRGGDRSAAAAAAFRASGSDAYCIAGGLLALAEQGRPLEPEGGEVAARSGLPDR
jgi:hydroxyacylglutathione hydrolase/adenylyltransferase/sulfurtransferase